MQTHANIEIDRPIEEVFELTNHHVAEWSLVVVDSEELHQTTEGVGSTFRMITEDRGNRMEFDGVVTRFEPPFSSAVHMTGQMFDILAEYEFEDLGGRTRVTQVSTVTGKGIAYVMFLLMGWLIRRSSCKAGRHELESLKAYCEQFASVE